MHSAVVGLTGWAALDKSSAVLVLVLTAATAMKQFADCSDVECQPVHLVGRLVWECIVMQPKRVATVGRLQCWLIALMLKCSEFSGSVSELVAWS